MKILLQDEKTGIENVKRVEERQSKEEGGSILNIYMEVGGITTNEITNMITKAGLDKLTIISENGEVNCVYENYTKIRSIVTSYSDVDKYIRLTLVQRENR